MVVAVLGGASDIPLRASDTHSHKLPNSCSFEVLLGIRTLCSLKGSRDLAAIWMVILTVHII